MTEIYPDPPHLTVAVYSEHPEQETFARMHGVAEELGCRPLNLAEIAPADQEFELISDLGDAREVVSVNSGEYARVVAGLDSKVRVLRAGMVHQRLDKVLIEYVQRIGPGLHPIAVTMSAEALGVPESFWSAGQRRSAYAIGDWCRSFLEAASSRCHAMYGAIGVEFSLPTPWQITTKSPRLPTELFISRQLVDKIAANEGDLRRVFSDGDTLNWDNGIFLSGWAPFNPKRATLGETKGVAANLLVALGSSLR